MLSLMIPLLVLASLLSPPASAPVPSSATNEGSRTIPIEELLVLDSVGRRSRSAVFTDALLAELVTGGEVRPKAGDTIAPADGDPVAWRTLSPNEDGWFRDAALRGGWAFATLDVPHSGSFRLEASGHASVRIDGEPRYGDVYGLDIAETPLWLEAGTHALLFRAGRGALRARLDPAPAAVYLSEKDRTLPDLLRVEGFAPPLAAVLVANAGTEPLRGAHLRAETPDGILLESPLAPVPPSSTRKCAVRVPVPADLTAETVEVSLALVGADGEVLHEDTVGLRIRDPHQTHARTFVSEMDGSVQVFGVTPPPREGYDPEQPLDLLLTLHGASVEGLRQARGYRAREGVVVVAPTNRRPFGFDWEDWGRRDALEVLEAARGLYPTRPERTYLTGHSMGGHGTWQLGSHFPDRFAAIGPSAGWCDFWSYGGLATTFEDPVGAILERARNASRTLLLRENLLLSGVYVLHGDADETVPVREARTMRGELSAFHPNFAYYERAGAGHWWGDECMDWPPLVSFLRENETPERRANFAFTTVDPSVSSTCHGLGVLEQERPLEPSRVSVEGATDEGPLQIETQNVRVLELDPGTLGLAPDAEAETAFLLDGVALTLPAGSASRFERDGEGWRVLEARDPARRSPHRGGGFKSAFDRRFVLVYGTGGSAQETRLAFAKARFDLETWRYRGNGAAELVADVDFDAQSDPHRNVILYGNADTNSAWEAVLDAPPFELRQGLLALGSRRFEGPDFGLLAVAPRRESDLATVGVVGGTGLAGTRVLEQQPTFVSGVGYPDWFVVHAAQPELGLEGILGAGWFAADWSDSPPNDHAWR